jgi:hypothetical protein
MKDSAKGVNKATKGHRGTEERQQWRPKTTVPDLPTVTSETKKENDKEKAQRLVHQK